MSYLTRLNTLLTSTTSRYDSLRRNILPGATTSEADDASLTDPAASHVSRVLRAYYTEKGRPFPEWLGPDPKDAARVQQQQQQQQGYKTSRPVGSLRSGSHASEAGSVGRNTTTAAVGGGLGDIWNDNNPNDVGREERTPLRRGPNPSRRHLLPAADGPSEPQFQSGGGLNVRPLPSQRVGSYQSQAQGMGPGLGREAGRAQSPVPPGSSGGATGGAAERLKARLNRGGSGRSVDGGGGGGRFGDDGRDGWGQGGGGGSYATQGLSGWQGRR